MNSIIKQYGGDKISEGGYACVYHPALNCDGTNMNTQKYISKLQAYDYNAKNEIRINKLLKKIPLYKDFFISFDSYCKMNKSEMTSGMIKKCEPLKNSNEDDVLLIKMNYIDGDTLFNYLASIESPKKLVHEIIFTYNYLTESLSLLLKNNIVHYDIKSTNIMYSRQTNRPYIIDYGLSIDMKSLMSNKIKLSDTFYVYAPDYYIWCPEIHILNYIVNIDSKLNEKSIRDICKTVMFNNKIFKEIYTKEQLKLHEDSLIQYYVEKYKSLDNDTNKFIDFLLYTYDTWDNFSLSMMYLRILLLLREKDKSQSKFISLFSKLLFHNLSYDPEERFNVMKIDEYMLVEMFQQNDKKDTELVDNYISEFSNLLENIKDNKDDIQKSLKIEEKQLTELSKTIEK